MWVWENFHRLVKIMMVVSYCRGWFLNQHWEFSGRNNSEPNLRKRKLKRDMPINSCTYTGWPKLQTEIFAKWQIRWIQAKSFVSTWVLEYFVFEIQGAEMKKISEDFWRRTDEIYASDLFPCQCPSYLLDLILVSFKNIGFTNIFY